jgi:RNA 2',3'-cyclic 3'-phosphodiesterase
MRLFIAIELDNKTKDRISSLQEKLKEFDSKLVEKENLHMTLKFLGTVPDSDIPQVVQKLSNIKAKQFKIIINKTGVFPNEDEPRVTWIGGDFNEELENLKKTINKALPGFRVENHESHITLARIRSLEPEEYDKLYDVLNAIDDEVAAQPIEFDVKGFTLFQSTLTKNGPIYEKIPLKK